ncbi:AraC-type DNA-binding protein [Zobellia uliginosa]|uniref:AraC-type DNA-binding protein n=1 Tax=Zobellia uliginosa TaxID=143224 RepID=A0ABY1KRG6_9FLAO|nr:AraC family transcriptional regulator [Zobellia uliginosa]SIS67534.1 AraC-type DNA-binding protein [Zobellia uliginosa]
MDATIVIGEDAPGDVESQNGVLENSERHLKVDCDKDARVYDRVFEKGLNMPAILLDVLHSLGAKIKELESDADRNISKRLKVLKGKASEIISTGDVGDKEKFEHPKPMVDLSVLNATDRAFVERVIGFVEENISDNTYWVDDLSFDMNTSRSTFFRKLKKITGHAPKDFMRNLRLMKAGELLSSEEFRIAEVSYQVGFSDPNYFSKCFRKFYGTSPSDYIEMNRAS